MKRWVLVVACGLWSCDSAAKPADQFCPASPPPLADCFEGSFFAACGGIGPPVLACTTEDCRWFSGGCPAAGYTASACSAEDICCINNFPFDYDPLRDSNQALLNLTIDFFTWGRKPWDRERNVVMGTTIDPTVDASLPMTCTGQVPDGSPCTQTDTGVWAVLHDSLEINLSPGPFAGRRFTIEVMPREDGTYAARACVLRYTDVNIVATCPEIEPIECAQSGTVVLDRWPQSQADAEGLTGTVTATFASFSFSTGFQDYVPDQ